MSDRCDYCGRRFDRPSPHCENKHAKPTLAQLIALDIENDLSDRSGLDVIESLDADIQDEIRDKWAILIAKRINPDTAERA